MDETPPEARYRRLCDHCGRTIDILLAGRHWKARSLAAVVVLSLFRAFPSYDAFGTGFVKGTWRSAQAKFDSPLADMSRLFPPGSHESNLTFRLAYPAAAHLLRLHELGSMIAFGLSGIVLIYTGLDLAFQLTRNKRAALYCCVAVACVWPGVAAFHELRGGYYDAVALCLVLLALWCEAWHSTFALVFLAAWTDERALLAAPFLILFPLFREYGGRPNLALSKSAAVIAAVAGYAATRAYLTAAYSYPAALTGVGLAVFWRQTNILPLAFWTGLAGSWILVGAGFLVLILEKRYAAAAGFCAALALPAAAALVVVDVTRGMAYCLPAVFLALAVIARGWSSRRVEKLAAYSALLSFLVPTFYIEGSSGFWWLYPLPIQIGRWMLPVLAGHGH